MNTSKTSQSIRQGPNVKTPKDLKDPYEHKEIFNEFDFAVDHVKLGQFTEKDKRIAMERFLGNDEV